MMGLWLTNCFLVVSFMCVFKAIEVISGRTLWDDCRKGISTDLNLCSVKLYQLSLHIHLLHSIIEKYDNVHDSQFFSKKEGEREKRRRKHCKPYSSFSTSMPLYQNSIMFGKDRHVYNTLQNACAN